MNIIKESLLKNPAHLWIGQQKILVNKTIKILQTIFCKNNGCFTCITCRKVSEKQFYNIIWINPEKKYNLKDLEVIFQKINFALEKNEHFFFILQNAEFLTSACSNSLLKSVEEPPTGYHFIFLTERQNYIVETIQSRCSIQNFYNNEKKFSNSFLDTFTNFNLPLASVFFKILNKNKPTEQETIEYIDILLHYWNNKIKEYFINNKIKKYKLSLHISQTLRTLMKKMPMPGSSKLFWQNFYLQMQAILLQK